VIATEPSRHLVNECSALAPAVLAVPMLRRSDLVGFLAVGKKTNREIYRLDEIHNLARAVHQAGGIATRTARAGQA
jgi:signal transduction protein with GAF and PtsI domain